METKKSKNYIYFAIAGLIVLAVIFMGSGSITGRSVLEDSNLVKMKTSMGDITIELYPDKAPMTVENFKNYIKSDFYDNLVFHRVISGFMIQGGGFMTSGEQKETLDPIELESNNGLSNDKYTIAMARTLVEDSATSQFFINTADNSFLNYGYRDAGYAVFGKVVKGQDVVDKIGAVRTATKNGMPDWPVEEVIIYSIEFK